MTIEFTPELALTAACCRWPRSDERDEGVRIAAGAVRDWDLFERLVTRHRVAPLVRDALLCAALEAPPRIERKLAARAADAAVATLGRLRESITLQRAFDAAELPALILKGPAIGALAYGDPCLKESWDIDLLTSFDAAPEAVRLLEQRGYELRDPSALTSAEFRRFTRYAIEAVFVNRASGTTVELHWALDRNRRLLAGITARSATQTLSLAGGTLRTLANEPLFAYLTIHGTKHGWARLKWLADLAAFVSTMDEAALERCFDAAAQAGAGRAAAASLRLCQRLLGTAVPRRLIARAEGDPQARTLETAAVHCIARPVAPTEPGAPVPALLLKSLYILAPGPRHVLEQWRILWDRPLERARHPIGFHLLRLPRILFRRARAALERTRRQAPEARSKI